MSPGRNSRGCGVAEDTASAGNPGLREIGSATARGLPRWASRSMGVGKDRDTRVMQDGPRAGAGGRIKRAGTALVHQERYSGRIFSYETAPGAGWVGGGHLGSLPGPPV
jgi:hypothetical protein